MKKNLFLLSSVCFLLSFQSFSQTRHQSLDEPFVVYRVNEQQVKIDELSSVTDGKLEAFHNREKLYAYLKEGRLIDTFYSTGYEGVFSSENKFSAQDRQGNFAKGEVVCSGSDTFKSFVSYLVESSKEKKEELYKCLSFSKASYIDEMGSYFLEGGLAFPILTKDTTISFMPKQGLFPVFSKEVPAVKNVLFQLNQDVHKIDVSYQFFDDKKITFFYDFVESYLPRFLESPFIFLKDILWNGEGEEYSLKSFSIPSLDGQTGVLFEGDLNSKKGLVDKGKLTLFSSKQENISEVSFLNNSLFIDLKYPNSLTPILEGELKNINSSQMLSKINFFVSNLLKQRKDFITSREKASFLSGLEIKNLTIYDKDHNKKALINLKFQEDISEEMIKQLEQNPIALDLWVTGDVIVFLPTGKEMTVSFNKTDEVVVNGKAGNGKNEADLYGILKYIQKQMKQSIEIYLTDMQKAFNSIYILGPVMENVITNLKVKKVFESAHLLASKNYAYCMSELENEKIDFMYECKGIEPKLMKGVEIPVGLEVSLPDSDKYPLIMENKKTGKDMVYLKLKFQDKMLCETIANTQGLSCNNNELTMGFKPNIKND